MFNFLLILILFLLTACQVTTLVENVKKDFSPVDKAIIYNKSSNKKKSIIPLNGMILVKDNETIFTIANKYKVIPKDIITDNKLDKPYILKKNQILFLRNKNVYIIKVGDTLNKISLKFAVEKLDIVKLNKLNKPFQLNVGNKILIPNKKNYSLLDQIINKKVYKTGLKNYKYSNFKNKIIPNAPKFIWPAKGQIIKKYGKFGKGQHHDGINLKLQNNLPIYSSQAGKVAFIGSQIKKFGKLILIKHDNGWLTAYSNVGKYNITQGETVTKKQIIAYSTTDKEFFHFQIRFNRNPVNPLDYLN